MEKIEENQLGYLPEVNRGQRYFEYLNLVMRATNKPKENPFFVVRQRILFTIGLFTPIILPGVVVSYEGLIRTKSIIDRIYVVNDASQTPLKKNNVRTFDNFREVWMCPADGSVQKNYDEIFYEELKKRDLSKFSWGGFF